MSVTFLTLVAVLSLSSHNFIKSSGVLYSITWYKSLADAVNLLLYLIYFKSIISSGKSIWVGLSEVPLAVILNNSYKKS